MPVIAGSYVNPFYREVNPEVKAELNTRAQYYGQRVRSTRSGAYEKGIAFSYQRKSWARVKSIDPAYTLGMAGSKIMSNRMGDLTLYNSQRFVPNKALLKSLEISNEGTIGSLLKGKFTFVLYPYMTSSGFEIGVIERAFFTPGAEVEVSWGWSVTARSKECNYGRFNGIIYNFNWSLNPDLSITADCSIVSAATIALGHSGDLSTKKDEVNPPSNVLGNPIPGPNLAAVIDRDLTTPGFAAVSTLAVGQGITAGIPGVEGKGLPTVGGTTSGPYIPEYWAIGLPHQEVEPETNAPAPAGTPGSAVQKASAPPPPVTKTYFYIKLGVVVDFINQLIDRLEATGKGVNDIMGRLFEIQVWENITAYNPDVKSAYPFDVFFPDDKMGSYGPTITPYKDMLRTIKPPAMTKDIGIANILLGTDFVKNTYKNFVEENSANVPYKNISSFFEEIVKKINEAAGDTYQISVVQMERPDTGFPSPTTPGGKMTRTNRSILSIEDTLLSETITNGVKPYEFRVDIFKPLIKNAQISCKPPAAMATAAYASARSTGSPGSSSPGMKPNNALVDVTPTRDKDVGAFNTEKTGNAAGTGTTGVKGDIIAKADTGAKSGFNNSWSEQMRGSLAALKKNTTDRVNNSGHWLHQAAYPIDFTITIDGINGFKFGDTIKTTAIPKRYNKEYKMVFTVTKISHKIDESGWETTLNTKSRIEMA
jgi:hypothetical protein